MFKTSNVPKSENEESLNWQANHDQGDSGGSTRAPLGAVQLHTPVADVAATSDRVRVGPMEGERHRRMTHSQHAFKCSGNATGTQQSCRVEMPINAHQQTAAPPPHHASIITLPVSASPISRLSPQRTLALLLSSPRHGLRCALELSSPQLRPRSLIWTSDVPKHDVFSGKLDLSLNKVVSIRRSPVVNAAVRSSSESSSDFQGRYSGACIDQACPLSCPVNREANVERCVERWVEESVHDIVRNIQEAPFLQYIFDSRSRFRRSQRQKLSQEFLGDSNYWPSVRDSLTKVDPDGLILVQKLEPGCAATCCLAEVFGDEQMVCPLQAEGAETNVWGVFVQARGLHGASACYLLKTTRVSSSGGACTRFCLTRATCFGPSYVQQLENAWLL